MLPVILAGLRAYTPYVVFPAAFLIGSIGYFIESRVSNNAERGSQQDESTIIKRAERLLSESNSTMTSGGELSSDAHTILSRNLSNPEDYKK